MKLLILPKIGLPVFIFLFSMGKLVAQCDRVGWVASSSPDCGAKIIDLNNGEILRAVAGADNLTPGKTMSFSSVSANGLATCPNETLPTVSLTCVSDKIPCKADFVPVTDEFDPMTVHFSAQIFDPSSQNCLWDFGDGTTEMGQEVVHTFSDEGKFSVILTVKSDDCEASKNLEVAVSHQNVANCGYELEVNVVGKLLTGKIVSRDHVFSDVKKVNWYFSKTNQIIAQTVDFQYILPSFGSYNVCAEILAETPGGDICASTRCQQVSLSPPGCTDPAMVSKNVMCPTFFAPVCGCDGVTYGNECEAIASGLTTWWAGKCNVPTPGTCVADVDARVISGNQNEGFLTRFYNLAGGDFAYLQLDFGDGSPILQTANWDSVEYRYALPGIYLANLTVWKSNGCVSSVVKVISTDWATVISDEQPQGSENVLPGDANGDKKANAYDLLNVGVGYFSDGAPRPNVSTNWSPQLAANWPKKMVNGLNFKHLDCDGNGSINELDPSLIHQYYSPLDTSEVVFNPAAPKIWLDFSGNPDTIFVDPNNPKPLEISADVMVATVGQPVHDLYGLAFAVKYPYFVNQDPEVNYYDNSNFGFSNDILWLPKNNPTRKQLDLGFVRKNGQGKNGYFKMAKITFKTDYIIIIDVVYREAGAPKPFVTDIKGLLAIDPKGLPKDLSLPAGRDTIWVKLKTTTATSNLALQNLVSVFPNPANGSVTLQAGSDLKMENVEVLNSLGQRVQNLEVKNQQKIQFETAGFGQGIFTLKIQTDRGIVEKRLVVER